MEALVYPNALDIKKRPTYGEILNQNGELKTLQEIKEQGIIIDWWSYAQIATRYKKDNLDPGIYRTKLEIDIILTGEEGKMIKKGYSVLIDRIMEEEIVKETMVAWAQNFGYSIELQKWQNLWEKSYKLTLATSYRENLVKMFYRWHIPPARIAKMFRTANPNCWKCKHSEGTYYHMWWTCPRAKSYWAKVRRWCIEITTEQIPLKPEIFLLGIFPERTKESTKYLGLHIITAARLTFAKKWKNPTEPSLDELRTKILECAEMDRLTQILKEKGETDYYRFWQKFYDWLKRKKYQSETD